MLMGIFAAVAIIIVALIIFILLHPKSKIKTTIVETGTNIALEYLRTKVFNKELEGIGKILQIYLKDKRLIAHLILNGLEDRQFVISCDDIRIASDGSDIQLKRFSSNSLCIQNILNDFARRTYKMPNDRNIRENLRLIRNIVDLK